MEQERGRESEKERCINREMGEEEEVGDREREQTERERQREREKERPY